MCAPAAVFREPQPGHHRRRRLSETGDNRTRQPHAETAADGSQALVTRNSGKHPAVGVRSACDKRLRNHLCVLADSTRHWHRWNHHVYQQRSIDRGADHPHQVPIVGRAWTRVPWPCRQNGGACDPAQHRALTRRLARHG
jgi:hypothetical protein